jgi:uncharacterized protein (DUF1501 family)
MNESRRYFLRTAGALGATLGPTMAPFAVNLAAMGAAAAQTSTDYRALVCVFLYGGNDHANTVLATDSSSWSPYRAARWRPVITESVALDLSSAGGDRAVLDIAPITAQSGRSFALHPQLGKLRELFNARRAAIVANVGPLIVPTTKAQYEAKSVPLPAKLGSHNDQASTWQAMAPEGARAGWGGRMGDVFASANRNPSFTAVSATGNAVFLSGSHVVQYQISRHGAVHFAGLDNLFDRSSNSAALRTLLTTDRTNLLEKELVRVQNRSIAARIDINSNMASPSAFDAVTSQFYGAGNGPDDIGTQLQTVARMIAGRSGLGSRRQVFFVSMGGFDTHTRQMDGHAAQLGRLGTALGYFDALLGHPAVNAANSVTAFTASDFGRTLSSNSAGTDHGWGGHHFVVGAAVRGGDIYGRFPTVGVDTNDDVGLGTLLPAISVDQYAYTLGKWFGLSATDLAAVLPNVLNFDAAKRDLGFMG